MPQQRDSGAGKPLPGRVSYPGERGLLPESDSLSPREREVLELLRRGLSYREVAETLGVSYSTVKVLAHRLRRKGVNLAGQRLSRRERLVLELLRQGKPYREIAGLLGISYGTIG